MSSPEKYAPKHRAPGAHKKRRRRRPSLRATVTTAVATTATGVAVSAGMLAGPGAVVTAADAPDGILPDGADATASELVAERDPVVSRADRRGPRAPAKTVALDTAAGPAETRSLDVSQGDPREIARALLPDYGFAASEFGCLDSLYVSESNWRVDADNPTSSAYGIPQALTATHDLPEGYMTSAEVQIRWGLQYIANRYGTPCRAWEFKYANNWY